jgi:hypothetical protein
MMKVYVLALAASVVAAPYGGDYEPKDEYNPAPVCCLKDLTATD